MLHRVIQIGLASMLSTAIAGFGIAHAQDEAPVEGDPTTGEAPAADGTEMPAAEGDAMPADEGSGDGMMMVAKKFHIGAAALVGLPLSEFGESASLSIGGLAMVAYDVAPAIAVTGRLGYIQHLSDIDGVSFSTIPVWVGGKYSLGMAANRLFLAAEIGFNMNRTSVDLGGTSASDSESDFGLNVGAGYDMGPITLEAFLTMYDLSKAGDTLAVNATVGYYFAAF